MDRTWMFLLYSVANADAINNAGTKLASPDWKVNLYADWLHGNWSANATVNYLDGWRQVADEFAIRPAHRGGLERGLKPVHIAAHKGVFSPATRTQTCISHHAYWR